MSARTLTQEERDAIEQLIDRTSVAAVLDALSTIAMEKSEHIAANWQPDAHDARIWRQVSLALDQCAAAQPVRVVSR